MHRWSAILALLAPAVLAWPAAAQDYPTRPIRAIASHACASSSAIARALLSASSNDQPRLLTPARQAAGQPVLESESTMNQMVTGRM